MSKQQKEFWYRIEDFRTAFYDPFGDDWSRGPSGLAFNLIELEVLSYTPKGVWLKDFSHMQGKRFVLKDANKRYACPTIEEARISFKARKRRQIKILTAQLSNAQEALEGIDKWEHKTYATSR